MVVALIPGDPSLLDLAGIVFLLVVVPILVLAIMAIVTGYIQHDAEAFLEELEAEEREGEHDGNAASDADDRY